jgi:hypothetical protein
MNKFSTLKRKKERELLQAAQPIITILLEISNLQKEIAEKEKRTKIKQVAAEEMKKLRSKLKKKEKE